MDKSYSLITGNQLYPLLLEQENLSNVFILVGFHEMCPSCFLD